MSTPSARFDTLATGLRWLGLLARLAFALELVAWFAVIKLAPPGTSTSPFFGLLALTMGVALGPGWGLPTLITGRMRLSAGLLGALSTAASGRPPEASGAGVRLLGGIVLFAGLNLCLVGLGLIGSALTGLLREALR